MIRRREFVLSLGVAAALSGRALAESRTDLLVQTQNGVVRGRRIGGVRAFTGIPYAEPPIGPLRFQAPRLAQSWRGVFDATKPAATPPQNEDPSLPPAAATSEDCLQINVWVPNGRGPFPVLAWIYGGGNSTGASNQDAYQGQHFARDGIVCVSFNYRVGVLGFLELGGIAGFGDAGSGNNAVRDQLLALQWIQANIGAFGGDRENVTIAGQSAGAWNCTTLMALPEAKGLFHQAIIASGGADTVFTLQQACDFADVFVSRLGGRERLLTASVHELLEAQRAAESEFAIQLPFRPVIDGTFLSDVPLNRLRAGEARHIKTLIGHTHDEYRTFLSPTQAARPIPQKLLLHLDSNDLPHVTQAYRRAFPQLSPGDLNLKLLGDEVISMPTLRVAEAQAMAGAAVFYYVLRYSIPSGPFGPYSPHGMDVPLIFENVDSAFARHVFGYRPTDLPMAQMIHAAWVSFVRDGKIGNRLPDWPRYEIPLRRAMLFDRLPKTVVDDEAAERRIWAHLQ